MIISQWVELALVDDDGAGGRIKLFFPPALSFSALQSWATSFANAIGATSSAAIVDMRIGRKYKDMAAPLAGAGSTNSRVLVLLLETESGKHAVQRVPACKDFAPDVSSAAPWEVDLAAAPIVALVEALKQPIVFAANYRKEHYTRLAWAYRGIELL